MTQILLVSNVLQWIVLAALLSVLLVYIRLVGILNDVHSNGSKPGPSLKGTNIAGESVYEARRGEQVLVSELLNDSAMILLLTDPGCRGCSEAIQQLSERAEFPWKRVILVVRGSMEAVVQFSDEFPLPRYVVMEQRGLSLSSRRAPMGAIVSGTGYYVTVADVMKESEITFILQALSIEDGRERFTEAVQDDRLVTTT